MGLMFTGITAMLVFLDWRHTYLIYALIALVVLFWNYIVIPKLQKDIKIHKFNGAVKNDGKISGNCFLFQVSYYCCFWCFLDRSQEYL